VVIINGTDEKPLILEDDTVVGVGTCVIRDVSASTFIGVGETVVKDIPDKVLAFGNPCKNMRSVSIGEKLV
jgi:acetyltransferase-like isoleucine patch superfamily enzyme